MAKKKIKYNENMDRVKTVFMLGLILIALIAVSMLTVRLAQFVSVEKQSLTGEANVEGKEVALLLFPTEVKESVGSTFVISAKAVGPADKRLASVGLTIFFDKEHLLFKSIREDGPEDEIVLLKSSSPQEANNSGEIKIFMGALSYENAPTGAINLAQLGFEVKKEGSSEVRIELSQSQVVFTNQEPADLRLEGNTLVKSIAETTVEPSPSPQIEEPTTIPTPTIILTATEAPTPLKSQ